MRRKEREITERAEIEDIINRAEVCHLAMIDGDVPYVVPLNFGYKGGSLYFHSAREGRKIEALKANPKVSFTMYVDDKIVIGNSACECTSHYKCVMGAGRAEVITDKVAKIEGLTAITGHYSPGGPFDFHEKLVEITTIIKVNIESMTGKKAGD